MTRSVQIVERMRWMSAIAGAAVLAIVVAIALGATGGQLRTVVPGASSEPAAAAGRRPRSIRASPPLQRTTPALLCRRSSSSMRRSRRSRHSPTPLEVHGRLIGNLPIIHGLAAQADRR